RWLKRTGNYKVHHNIKKRPFEVHALEKPHLQTVSGNYVFDHISPTNITRKIHKDNVIRFEGNRYSVPLGTFKNGQENIAYVSVTETHLNITLQPDSLPVASHRLSERKGQVITDPSHRHRSTTKRDQRMTQVFEALDDTELAAWLVDTLQRRYPRHLVDQLKIVLK